MCVSKVLSLCFCYSVAVLLDLLSMKMLLQCMEERIPLCSFLDHFCICSKILYSTLDVKLYQEDQVQDLEEPMLNRCLERLI